MSYPQNPYKPSNSDAPYEVDADVDASQYATESYQSGRPLLQSQQQNNTFQAPISTTIPNSNTSYYPTTQPDHASYVTSTGWPLHHLVRFAWVFPPFTGVVVLIFETSNVSSDIQSYLGVSEIAEISSPPQDLVRFHAYQASLCGVIGVLIYWILNSWFGWNFVAGLVLVLGLAATWYAGYVYATFRQIQQGRTSMLIITFPTLVHRHLASESVPTLSKHPYLPHIGL